MFEISDSEINVDRVMHEIREDVARQHRIEGQKVSASLSGISLTGRSGSDLQGDSSQLSLQPEFHSRHDDQYHINDLLKYHGEDFVRNAYRALLKREPDPSGWTRYLESLASGRLNKVDILASLRYSPEGERAQVKVAGLAWPATIRRLERVPIIGYLLQMVVAVGRLPRLLRHQRQSEFYLLGQLQRTVDHDNQVHKQLAEALAQISARNLAGTERAENQQQAIESLLLQQQGEAERQREFRDAIETRLLDARQHLDQCLATITREMEERAEKLVGGQQQLTQQVEEQTRQQQQVAHQVEEQTRRFSDQQQQVAQQAEEQTRQFSDQQQLTQKVEKQTRQQQQLAHQVEEQTQGLLRRQQQTHTELVMQERRLTSLLEEARRHPPGTSHSYLDLLANEENHLLDPLYASFEDQFRGDRDEVKNRLEVYLPILRNAAIAEGVLDIGCGRGEWLELLRNEGVQGRGVDHNRVFIEQCRQIGLDVVEEDALVYLRSLPENSLFAITSFHLVEHLGFEELIKVLDETVRTLRPGGLVILETPNPENFMVGSCNFYADPTHRNPIPSPTLKFLLESRGLCRLEVMKLRPWDAAKIEGDSEIIKRFNEYFYGPPDYGIFGWKV